MPEGKLGPTLLPRTGRSLGPNLQAWQNELFCVIVNEGCNLNSSYTVLAQAEVTYSFPVMSGDWVRAQPRNLYYPSDLRQSNTPHCLEHKLLTEMVSRTDAIVLIGQWTTLIWGPNTYPTPNRCISCD